MTPAQYNKFKEKQREKYRALKEEEKEKLKKMSDARRLAAKEGLTINKLSKTSKYFIVDTDTGFTKVLNNEDEVLEWVKVYVSSKRLLDAKALLPTSRDLQSLRRRAYYHKLKFISKSHSQFFTLLDFNDNLKGVMTADQIAEYLDELDCKND